MEQELLARLAALIMAFRAAKPADRSELARRYAITITELEKTFAFAMMFVGLAPDLPDPVAESARSIEPAGKVD